MRVVIEDLNKYLLLLLVYTKERQTVQGENKKLQANQNRRNKMEKCEHLRGRLGNLNAYKQNYYLSKALNHLAIYFASYVLFTH